MCRGAPSIQHPTSRIQHPKSKDIFDINSDNFENNSTSEKHFDKVPDDIEDFEKFYFDKIKEFDTFLNSEHLKKLYKSNNLLLEKDTQFFIYENENKYFKKFNLISSVGRQINKEFNQQNKYLNVWCSFSRLFPTKSAKYFSLIKSCFKKDKYYFDQMLKLYDDLLHSNYVLYLIYRSLDFQSLQLHLYSLFQQEILLHYSK